MTSTSKVFFGERKKYEFTLSYKPKKRDGSWPTSSSRSTLFPQRDGTFQNHVERERRRTLKCTAPFFSTPLHYTSTGSAVCQLPRFSDWTLVSCEDTHTHDVPSSRYAGVRLSPWQSLAHTFSQFQRSKLSRFQRLPKFGAHLSDQAYFKHQKRLWFYCVKSSQTSREEWGRPTSYVSWLACEFCRPQTFPCNLDTSRHMCKRSHASSSVTPIVFNWNVFFFISLFVIHESVYFHEVCMLNSHSVLQSNVSNSINDWTRKTGF